MSWRSARRWAFCSVVIVSSSIGCSVARHVEMTPTGGVVAIPSNTNSWPFYNHSKAEELIREKCPQGYEIEREGEAVVGHTHFVQTNTQTTGDPLLAALRIAPVEKVSNETTSVLDQTEWRIYYRSK